LCFLSDGDRVCDAGWRDGSGVRGKIEGLRDEMKVLVVKLNIESFKKA
jgi:hypothetical protein